MHAMCGFFLLHVEMDGSIRNRASKVGSNRPRIRREPSFPTALAPMPSFRAKLRHTHADDGFRGKES